MAVLREGFTTGSCAAAAALACCLWQRDGACPSQVSLTVPAGKVYTPVIIPHADGSCGIIKDSGDDPDITNGMEVVTKVELLEGNGGIVFCSGEGVGTVTENGLKIPAGEPAINPVPRQMIEDAVRSVYPDRKAKVTVSVPGGEEIAKKTFNPRLGIVGGISILGTSGIVRPMSDEALRESLYVELKMRISQGKKDIVFTFGNQGEEMMRRLFPDACVVQISNEVGYMLDSALQLGAEHILLGGHPGKLSKVAAGVMQTHSKYGDARLEAIITQLARMQSPADLIEGVYTCKTTDAAMKLIHEAGYNEVWNLMARAAQKYCGLRVRHEMEIDIVYLDAQGNIIGKTME